MSNTTATTNSKEDCKHESQYFMKEHRDGCVCYAWNECNDCGKRLPPSIDKAEESKFLANNKGEQ